MSELFYISVIIPSFNRANLIGITLESFVKQDYPKTNYEIIVVDNNSTDSTRRVVNTFITNNKNTKIRYVLVEKQGVHWARNSAAWLANCEILYFTDDDMIADPNLLKEIVKPFLDDNLVGTVTGRVLPKWEKAPPDWVSKLCYNGLLSLNDVGNDIKISIYDIGVFSCHQAIKRDVFFKTGGFNPENTAGEWIGDGETGLNIKIQKLGYKFAYNGMSLIYHIIPPYRMTQSYLNKRLENQGNCDSYTEYKRDMHNIIGLSQNIIKFFFKYFVTLFSCFKFYIYGNILWRLKRAYLSYYISRIKYEYRLIIDYKWRNLVRVNDWLDLVDDKFKEK